MSLQQYYQFEYQHPLFDLSAGSIKDFNFFNIHSSRQGDEFDNAKVESLFCLRIIELMIDDHCF